MLKVPERVPCQMRSAPTDVPYMLYQKLKQRAALSAGRGDAVSITAFCWDDCGSDVSMYM